MWKWNVLAWLVWCWVMSSLCTVCASRSGKIYIIFPSGMKGTEHDYVSGDLLCWENIKGWVQLNHLSDFFFYPLMQRKQPPWPVVSSRKVDVQSRRCSSFSPDTKSATLALVSAKQTDWTWYQYQFYSLSLDRRMRLRVMFWQLQAFLTL